jgi:hypothetical protein
MKQTIGFQIDSKGRLVPFGDEDVEMMKHYKKNQRVLGEIQDGKKLGVSIPQFNLYFACCDQVALNSSNPSWDTKPKVDHQIRLGIGWIDFTIIAPDGTVSAKPKSLSHKNISHFVFNNYFSNALDLMATKLKVTIEQLIHMAEQNMRS